MTIDERYEIKRHEDFPAYIDALYHVASQWIPEIRIQFANKAYEMFQNETVRKIVLEYGKARAKSNESMTFWFESAADSSALGEPMSHTLLERSCLDKTKSYADTIWFLFDIQHKKD